MHAPEVIDTNMHGFPEVTATYVVRGSADVALVETGPKSRVADVLTGLERLGIDKLRWIVVTHIHLDHAGAAGTIAQRFPEATVAVHGVGAPHLVDPSKLWASASRIYGDAMEKMWGGIDPLPSERVHVVEDGDEIDLGGRKLTALETPGHAGHHHAYVDDATGAMFTGDALGVRLPGVPVVRPATPPPEFNLERAVASIERIRDAAPTELWPTHFGRAEGDVGETCEQAIESLQRWAGWVSDARAETRDVDEIAERLRLADRDFAMGRLSPENVDRLEQTTSYRMNVQGYMRYFDKKEQAASGQS